MEKIYSWNYLESLISKYYGTQECFIESFEDEKNLGISYELFRKHKTRKTKKYLKNYIDFILENYGSPYIRIGENFIEIFEEVGKYHTSNFSVDFINKGEYFELSKSWEKSCSESYIKEEVFLVIQEVLLKNFIKEIFNNKLLINIIKKKLVIYINKKIDLIDHICFRYEDNLLSIKLKFDEKEYIVNIPLEEFKNKLHEEIYEEVNLLS